MEKGIYVITAAFLIVVLVYGCIDLSSLPFGSKEEVNATPVNEVSKLFFTATLLQTEVFAGSRTALTFRIENKWMSQLEGLEVRLDGFSYEVGGGAAETNVVLQGETGKATHSITTVAPGVVAQRQFSIFMPRRLVEQINIRPTVCFDYTQTYRKDIILVPEFTTLLGSEIRPEGPLTMTLPLNTILASDEIFPGEDSTIQEFVQYSLRKRNVDSIVKISDFTLEIQKDSGIGIDSFGFSYLSSSNTSEILCSGVGVNDTCVLVEKPYVPRQETEINGLITLDILKPVTSNEYKSVTMTAKGRYCVILPELTLKVRKL